MPCAGPTQKGATAVAPLMVATTSIVVPPGALRARLPATAAQSQRRRAQQEQGGPGPAHGDGCDGVAAWGIARARRGLGGGRSADRKSTRLNSSHLVISYAVFCLKNKNVLVDDGLELCIVHNAGAQIYAEMTGRAIRVDLIAYRRHTSLARI